MQELRTISKCDHKVTDVQVLQSQLYLSPYTDASIADTSVTPTQYTGATISFVIPGNIEIIKIDDVHILTSDGMHRLFQKYNYELKKNNTIELVDVAELFSSAEIVPNIPEQVPDSEQNLYKMKIPADKPADWAHLVIDGLFSSYTYSEFTLATCPRCAKSGWYVDAFEPDEEAGIADLQKLTQHVIKCLFTDEIDGYGTNIKNLIGVNYASDDDFANALVEEVSKAERQIKQRENDLLSKGVALTDSERLGSIEISKIAYLQAENLYQVGLVIVAKDETYVETTTTI